MVSETRNFFKWASQMSLSLFFIFTLCACGAKSGHFRIVGKFKNINQGEFYIYSPDGAINGLDTIKVSDGRFAYEKPLNRKATFIILFPNFSEQPVFGESGATAEIEGDASHLKEMEIKGTDENELMTKFRKNVNRLSPPEAVNEAGRFIEEHPQSLASIYILKKYFIQANKPDYTKAATLLDYLAKGNPDNGRITTLKRQVDCLKGAAQGSAISNFTSQSVDGKTISRSQYKGKANVVNVWASWSYDSQNIQRQLSQLKKTYGSDLSLLGVCIDASINDCRQTLERDSIKWPNVCDGKMWNSPLLNTFGIGTVPGNVVFDRSGKVVGRNLNNLQLKEKIESLLR